jgi:protein-S-isoprenylcysteine O-methyltransferase Ste14
MKKLRFWKETWSLSPTAIFMIAGTWVSVHDFLYLHDEVFQSSALWGVLLIFLGTVLEIAVRLALVNRAGFSTLTETRRLLITDEHELITDGLFKRIRHPLYLGRITLDFGIALLFASFWGGVLMGISAVLFLIRIHVEEEMLIEEFGDAYLEYRRRTKKLVPYVF